MTPDRFFDSAAGRLAIGAHARDTVQLPDGQVWPLEKTRSLRDALASVPASPFARMMVRRFLQAPWTLTVSALPPTAQVVERERGGYGRPVADAMYLDVPPTAWKIWIDAIGEALDRAFPADQARRVLAPIADANGWYSYSGFALLPPQTSARRVLTAEQRTALVGDWDTGGPLTVRDLYPLAGAAVVDHRGVAVADTAIADAICFPRYRTDNPTVAHLALLAGVPAVVSSDPSLPVVRVDADFVEARDDVVFAEGWRLVESGGKVLASLGVFIPSWSGPVRQDAGSRASEICWAATSSRHHAQYATRAPWPLGEITAIWPALVGTTFRDPSVLAVLPVRAADARVFLEREGEVAQALILLDCSLRSAIRSWGGGAGDDDRATMRRQVARRLGAAWECHADAPQVTRFVSALEELTPDARSAEALLGPIYALSAQMISRMRPRRVGPVMEDGLGIGPCTPSEFL